MFRINERGCILVLGVNGWHQWRIKLGDLVALDWQVFSPEQQLQMRELAQRAAAESEDPGEQHTS